MSKRRVVAAFLLASAVMGAAAGRAQTTIIQQQPAAPPATVRISPEQRTIIKKRIGTVQPSATVRERVTVGTTLPADVELTPLPDDLYADVPTVRNYRYIVVGDDIVLVEPQTRRIIEVFPE